MILLPVLLLFGCAGDQSSMDGVFMLRNELESCQKCSFSAKIAADYGSSIYEFVMHCSYERNGNMSWELTEPQTIAGIKGYIQNGSGQLTFDEEIVAFEMLADEQITPAASPWLLLEAIRGGYIRSCGEAGGKTRIQIDDSFANVQFYVDVWLDADNVPVRGEIVWQGRRIMSIDINEFIIV